MERKIVSARIAYRDYKEPQPFEARPTRSRTILAILGGIALAGAAVVWATGAAWSHPIPGSPDLVYPSGCCHSAATHTWGDCAPVASHHVREVEGGYQIELAVGDHPKLKGKGYSAFIPHDKVRVSPNADFHICLSTDGAQRYCFLPHFQGVEYAAQYFGPAVVAADLRQRSG